MENEQVDSTPKAESAEEQKQSIKELLAKEFEGTDVEEATEEPEPLEENPQTEQAEGEESDARKDEEEITNEEQEEKVLEPIDAPQHWSKEFKEKFEKLPPEGQHIFMDRYKELESDYTKKTQNLAQFRKRNEAFDELFRPFRDDFQRAGMDDIAATRQLLSAHKYLRQNPKEAINWLAGQYGVNLSEVTANDTAEDDYASDPQIKEMRQQIAQLQNTLKTNAQVQQQNEVATTQSLIDDFANAKDPDGNLKHPHFEAVRETMGRFVKSGEAKSLDDAYDKAIYAIPEIRQKMLDNYAQKKVTTEVKTDAVKKAKKAQRSTVRGSGSPSKQQIPSNLSVRETLNLTLKQLGER
jgi:hypothetical protein